MKGRLFLSLFALPFAGVGLWMLWSIASMIVDAHAMADWRPVTATLEDAGYHSRSSDDGTTFEAYARYRYRVDGREYVGDRVGLGRGADNLGDYQRDTGQRLAAAHQRGQPITVFVDPDAAEQAVIDPTLRWSLIGFQAMFLLLFGGVGVGAMVFAWRPRPATPTAAGVPDREPWLGNRAWQTPTLRSSSKATMWFAWVFAGVWSLISAPLPFIVWSEVVEKHNHAALLALLFPLIGIGLALWALRRTLEWHRYGPAPVTLDPFPGSIGGHVGGTIALAARLPADATVEVTLTCLRSSLTGTGKDRRRREEACWQDSRAAHVTAVPGGSRLSFRFDVPDQLPPADAIRDDASYHLWRLNVQAPLPGTDFDRDYDIPVYPTRVRSASLPDSALALSDQRRRREVDAEIAAMVDVQRSLLGNRLRYPVGRQRLPALTGALFGATFAGAGWWLLAHADSVLFGVVFGAVGAPVAVASSYLALNSLEVYRDGADIVSVRRVLGLPVLRRRLPLQRFARLERHASLKSNQGGKHTISYSVRALDHQGHGLTVGEGFRGDGGASAGMRLIARELGLGPAPAGGPDSLPDELDIGPPPGT